MNSEEVSEKLYKMSRDFEKYSEEDWLKFYEDVFRSILNGEDSASALCQAALGVF